ncbi:MAG: gephyrin-like molybdotransferase Glp [Dongiaceae bacterium]
MISVEDARSRILGALQPLGSEVVALAAAHGRVLAEDVAARLTQPPAAVSAMDGYAVRGADLGTIPARLRVVGQVAAGSGDPGTVGPGEAARIFTGAALPAGADTIVIQEDADRAGDWVSVREATATGAYVRRAGLDFAAGELGLGRGRLLTARDIGLAAAMNWPWLRVTRRPRVAILATGDEVVMPGEPIAAGQIVSSNALALAAFVAACGGEPLNLGVVGDDRAAIAAMAAAARGADLLVTTGGASVGEHDLVQAALGDQGLELDFWKIAMRPGKPLLFGRLGGTPVLGLPGNPVSALVCAAIFLRPALQRLLGRPAGAEPAQHARLGAPLPANDRRQDYLRARLGHEDGAAVATAFPVQDSSMVSRLAWADCLIVRPPLAPALAAGATVEILGLGGGTLST